MICAGYGGALEERHIHTPGAVGHTVMGGDVLVDCGVLGYEVKGPDWFGEAVQVNRHSTEPHLLSEIKPVGSVDAL